MKDFNRTTAKETKVEWLTPPYIIKSLGYFDLDPCAPHERIRPWDTAIRHYSENGLNRKWHGRVWCNPPYGKKSTFEWLDKLADHGDGIALIFSRTETIGFHNTVWERADAIFFFKGRLAFYHVDGTKGATANAPSCLIAYGKQNVEAIRNSGLKGKLLEIYHPKIKDLLL